MNDGIDVANGYVSDLHLAKAHGRCLHYAVRCLHPVNEVLLRRSEAEELGVPLAKGDEACPGIDQHPDLLAVDGSFGHEMPHAIRHELRLAVGDGGQRKPALPRLEMLSSLSEERHDLLPVLLRAPCGCGARQHQGHHQETPANQVQMAHEVLSIVQIEPNQPGVERSRSRTFKFDRSREVATNRLAKQPNMEGGSEDPAHVNQRFGMAYSSVCGSLVRIEIERATGSVRIAKAYTAVECGQALVPEVVVGQAQGAFAMGVGYALLEVHAAL
jgi:hypothetical protein